jgi:hypothetical protein
VASTWTGITGRDRADASGRAAEMDIDGSL